VGSTTASQNKLSGMSFVFVHLLLVQSLMENFLVESAFSIAELEWSAVHWPRFV
jgi:hypothetical protein